MHIVSNMARSHNVEYESLTRGTANFSFLLAIKHKSKGQNQIYSPPVHLVSLFSIYPILLHLYKAFKELSV